MFPDLGEFRLIDGILEKSLPLKKGAPEFRDWLPVGDDAAEFDGWLATKDLSVEGTHFRLDWSTPEQAVEFVNRTGVDALAVSIGSAHGFYKLPPHLDIPRLAAIHAATPVALVLHGSSGIPHDQVREAIANGIVKVNLATEIKDNFMRALKKVLSESDEIDLRKVFPKAMDPVVELLKEKYAVTGARAE